MELIKKDEFEILSTELLNDKYAKKEVYYWIKMFAAAVGWHYPLDLIWQYKKIKALNLPKGSIILDAGAGYGVMQYILAGNGYNVISVDFLKRKKPLLHSYIFKISNEEDKNLESDYTEHLIKNSKFKFSKVFNKLKLILVNSSILFYLNGLLNKKNYGSIKFIQADFKDLSSIPSNYVDAIVSTSAVEHNPSHESLKKGISEFNRVLKPNSAMFITTSFTNKDCVFDKPSKGYLYDEKTLLNIFNLVNYESNLSEYSTAFKKIHSCSFLKKNIPYYYKDNPNCGLPYGIWNPYYLPIGVVKWKS
jgi:ubiquinone/menaquinone biosynthesis C-methylase UbiE